MKDRDYGLDQKQKDRLPHPHCQPEDQGRVFSAYHRLCPGNAVSGEHYEKPGLYSHRAGGRPAFSERLCRPEASYSSAAEPDRGKFGALEGSGAEALFELPKLSGK